MENIIENYKEMKQRHPDAILLFRVRDFYETFFDDAKVCGEILGITVTSKKNGDSERISLARFPDSELDNFLPKLVRAGKRVAICEKLDTPACAPSRTPAQAPSAKKKTPKQIHEQAMRIYEQIAIREKSLDERDKTLAMMLKVQKMRADYIDAIYRANGIECEDGIVLSGTQEEKDRIWNEAATSVRMYTIKRAES